MTGFLASVSTLEEARIALRGGADIIDLKAPALGALGAVSPAVQRSVVALVGARRCTSATTGDLPMQPDVIRHAIARTAGSGVDLVKVGLPALERHRDCLRAVADSAAAGIRVVAVLFAELKPPLWLVDELAQAGCHGVMLDTGNKADGGLRRYLPAKRLEAFLQRARRLHLLNALAGSLQADDIAALLPLAPDYLGFRGALCDAGVRTAGLSAQALARIRAAIPAAADAALSQARG